MARPRKYPQGCLTAACGWPLEGDRAHRGRSRNQLGVLRKRVRQAEADQGLRKDLLTREEREGIRRLRRETAELRCANEIVCSASLFVARELDPDRPRVRDLGLGATDASLIAIAERLAVRGSARLTGDTSPSSAHVTPTLSS